MRIATIINYCTNDYRFLSRSIEEVSLFSSQIIVPVCDHFFDGTPENRPLLDTSYAEHPGALFLEFAYDENELYTPYIRRTPADEDWRILWHSTARYLSFLYLDESIEYLLFLDADEIVEGEKFAAWLQWQDFRRWDALWFYAYRYGFLPSLLAPDFQLTGLLVRRRSVSPLLLFNSQERFGIFSGLAGAKRMQIVGLDGKPMIHHYSWVRPEAERLKKSRTWGKKHLRNWEEWLEKNQNSNPETDSYREVPPYFDPLSVPLPPAFSSPVPFPNVIRVDRKTAFRKELSICINSVQDKKLQDEQGCSEAEQHRIKMGFGASPT